MSNEYATRAPRLIEGIPQWIQGKIRNDENRSIYNEAFNEFVEKIHIGENLINAKRKTQKQYGVPIEYDTVFPKEIHEKSTLIVWVG